MVALFLLACADATPVWAVQHASVIPTESGLSGTQTWEFFSSAWQPDAGDEGYICARVQTLEATVTPAEGCATCRAGYALTVTELDSDCTDDIVADRAFSGPDVFAIGDVAAGWKVDDPHTGKSLGWMAGFGDGELVDVGFAWPEALDNGDPAAPGWTNDRAYTLWPAVAWQL